VTSTSAALIVAGAALVIAALLHFACIFIGAKGYRLLGAGNKVVNAVESGDLRPHFSAVAIGTALFVCSWYLFAAAGYIAAPPLMQPVLYAVSGALLSRALLFPLLKPYFPGNSLTFWVASSVACGLLGALILYGALNRPQIHGA